MKEYKKWAMILMAIFTIGAICACGSDDDEEDSSGTSGLSGTYASWRGTEGNYKTYSVIHFVNSNTLVYYQTVCNGFVSGKYTDEFKYKSGWYYGVNWGGMEATCTYTVEGNKVYTTHSNISVLTISGGKLIPDGYNEDYAFEKIGQ